MIKLPLKVQIENHTFYGYTSKGNEQLPNLLCLHGMTGDSNSFLELSEYLEKDFHLICIDSPGHGGTGALNKEEDYYFSSLAKQINEVVSQLTEEPLYILGHSWGADLSLHVAKAYPEKVKGIILVDGGYAFPEHIEGMSLEKAYNGWKDYISASVYDSWEEVVKDYQDYTTRPWNQRLEDIIKSNFDKVDHRYVLKADSFSLLSTIKAFYREPCSTTFNHISCPVLLFHATCPTEDASRTQAIKHISKGIRNIKRIGIENTKHNVHWDAPEDLATHIKLWIKEFEESF